MFFSFVAIFINAADIVLFVSRKLDARTYLVCDGDPISCKWNMGAHGSLFIEQCCISALCIPVRPGMALG